MTKTLVTVQSTDGTRIALDVTGSGHPVVLIGGAFNDRSTTAGLAQALAPHYQVATYDRRGRGDSGDESIDFSVDREMDDLEAVIGHLGGTASVFGHSSGAVLALEAAIRDLPVDKVAAYEPPFIPEGSRPRPAVDVAERLARFVETDDRDGATALYQTEVIGLPSEMVQGMRRSEMWSYFTRLSHSLPYDYALFDPGCPVPDVRLAHIEVPTLVIAGSNTFPWLDTAAQEVARVVPSARYLSLEGQDHGVLQQPEALLTCLQDFFG